MSKSIALVALVGILGFGLAGDVLARGGRGGTRGGRSMQSGGASVNRAPAVNRTPSLNRNPAQLPQVGPSLPSGRGPSQPLNLQTFGSPAGDLNRPGSGIRTNGLNPNFTNRPGSRTTAEGLGSFLNLPGEASSTPAQARGERANQPPDDRPFADGASDWIKPAGGRWENLQQNRPEQWDQRQDLASDVRNRWSNNYPARANWFNQDFWRQHPDAQWRYPNGFNYWRWATWGALSTWLPYAWGTPVYYDYGSGGNVYYQDGTVYVDDQPTYTTDEYAQQAAQIAEGVPQDLDATQEEWMPLGVFAVVPDRGSATDPTMFVQLAVSKAGVLSGTFQNTLSDEVQAVEGAVDRETQRAAWHNVGQEFPVMETGIYNLTKDETTALVHFDGNVTQQWLLVRLDSPENSDQQ